MNRLAKFLFVFFLISPLWAQYQVFERSGLFFFLNESIHVYFFKESQMGLRMRDEGDAEAGRYGSLSQAVKGTTALAGINGGYFGADAQHSPLGLLCVEGRQVSPFAQGRFTVAGTLYDTGKGIFLERSGSLSHPVSSMKAAVQAGPFLVEDGKPVAGLDSEKVAARSFVATDGQGQWCIGMASALSLKDLAKWLAKPNALGSFKLQKALNLDGGSSCTFWVKESSYYLPSYKRVRNYVTIVPR